MRPLITATALTALLACLSGCGGGEPPPRQEERPPPMPVEDTVFGDMIETQDRARAVEDLGFERKREMDRAIEDAGE